MNGSSVAGVRRAGKNVLITGASGGIGRALALAFAGRGYGVALNCFRHEEEAERTAGAIRFEGGSAQVYRADVSREEEVEAMFAAAERRFGFLDVLVNNAGTAWKGLLTEMSLGDWERVFGVNCTGVFLCCRRALPAMIREKRGAIVNISSMWGQEGASCEAAYSASKAAVIGLTQALAREEGPSGVRINCIAPGVIETPMNAGLTEEDLKALREETPLLRTGTPEEVAQAALFLAESGFITGQTLGVNGGFVI